MTTTPAMPERFTKEPVTVEAVQFTEALRDAIVLDGAPCPDGVKRGATTWHQKDRKIWRADFFIDTLEGRMNVEIGDWIIKGVKGEFYPCKPDIFEMTYDRAALQSAQPAEVSDEAGKAFYELSCDAWGIRPSWGALNQDERDRQRQAANRFLALRPQAVPMADAGSPGLKRHAIEASDRLARYAAAPFFPETAKRGVVRQTTPEWWDGLAELIEEAQPLIARAQDEIKRTHGITAPAGGEV